MQGALRHTLTHVDVLQYPTDKGWVGLGISEAGSMYGADLIVFRQVSGVWGVEDMHAKETGTPILDASQDVALLGAESANGHTFIKAKRDANTCQSLGQQDLKFVDAVQPFLFAFGESHELSYHGHNRMTAWLNPASFDPSKINALPADVREWPVLS